MSGASGGVGVSGCIGTGRECRYSGARRGIGSIRGIGDFLGSIEGVEAIRRYQGVSDGHQGV